MELPVPVVTLLPRNPNTGEVRYLVHERQYPFPDGRTHPFFPYAWFGDNRGFWSFSKSAFSPPEKGAQNDYVIRYVYRLKRHMEVIYMNPEEPDKIITDWLRKVYPEGQWQEGWDIVDYAEAAFLLQVLGYDGIYWKDHEYILSERLYDDLELYSILEFNITNKPIDIVQEYVPDVPIGQGAPPIDDKIKSTYSPREIRTIRQQLGFEI